MLNYVFNILYVFFSTKKKKKNFMYDIYIYMCVCENLNYFNIFNLTP